MTKKLFILFLLINYFSLYSQVKLNDLLGTWVNTKTEMKDGSKLIPYFENYHGYLEFSFKSGYYTNTIYPSQKSRITTYSYQLKNDQLIVSDNFKFEIEKVSRDSLLLVENINDLPDDKLKRFLLIRKSVLKDSVVSKLNKGNTFVASPYLTPKFNGSLSKYLNDAYKKRQENIQVNGILSIGINSKSVELNSVSSSNYDSKIDKLIRKRLKNSFKKWDLSDFKKFDYVDIEFIVLVEKTKTYRGTKVKLFTQSPDRLKEDYGKPMQVMNESSNFFNKGLRAFDRNDFSSAINFFSQSYDIDHTFIDALYNRATSYYSNNQLNMACIDWKRLKELGQKNGERYYLENCKKLED